MRVFKFISYCLIFGVVMSSEGGVLKPVLREDIKARFQQKAECDASLEFWVCDAEKEVKEFIKTLKSEEALRRSEAALVSVDVSSQIIEGVSVDIEKLLSSVSEKGWTESVVAIRKLLNDKNLYLSDLSHNPKLVKSFVSFLVDAEKKYREEKTKVENVATPITETKPSAYTPRGTLGQGLRLLKVISSFVDESILTSIEVDAEATLVKKFLSRE